jgi:hypothetical protein
MLDPRDARDVAIECRARVKTAIEPDVIDQLRLWAVELADDADRRSERETTREPAL